MRLSYICKCNCLTHAMFGPWAARLYTCLLIKLTLKIEVVSFLLFPLPVVSFPFFSFLFFTFGQPEAQAICWRLSAMRLDCVCTALLQSRACSNMPLTSMEHTPASLTWQHAGCMGTFKRNLSMAASEGVKHPGNTNLDAGVIIRQLHCWGVWTSVLATG